MVLKKKGTKKVADFIKNVVDFQNLMKIEFVGGTILIIYKPYTKFGPDRFSRLDVYWTQTKKKRKQTSKVSI